MTEANPASKGTYERRRAPVPTGDDIESERSANDLFLLLKGIKVMMGHFCDHIAEGNEEHEWGQSTLLMVEEVECRLDALLEVATLTPKGGANG